MVMKEYPIIFSSPMIRALLADRKTVTRRLSRQWLKVKAGDWLWVREGFAVQPFLWKKNHELQPTHYLADVSDLRQIEDYIKKSSIHMPRWASRISLEATEDARVERLKDITNEDAIREGIACDEVVPWAAYAFLWDGLHAKPGERWEDNPEVVRIAFTNRGIS